jgi:cytochrome c oxidase assembly factor CtaG
MVQHLLRITISPRLIVHGRPAIVYAWAMPRKARRKLARRGLGREAAQLLHALARPLPATLLHGAAVWIWHAPALFQAALSDALLHDLEHASFYVTALLFWHATLLAARAPSAAVKAILGLVITLIHSGLLGALLTLTPGPLYPAYGEPLPFGLTPLEDQQLAGLIMWVPASAIYLGAALHLASRLLFMSGRRSASGDWMMARDRASRPTMKFTRPPQQERVKVRSV